MSNTSAGGSINVRAWWTLLGLIAAEFVLWTFGALRDATSARLQDPSGNLVHTL